MLTHSIACTSFRVFEKDGVKLVIDNISYDFVKGATVDYVEELIRAAFQVTQMLLFVPPILSVFIHVLSLLIIKNVPGFFFFLTYYWQWKPSAIAACFSVILK